MPELPWQKGTKPFDPRVNVEHLRKVKGEAGERYRSALDNDESEEVSEDEEFDRFDQFDFPEDQDGVLWEGDEPLNEDELLDEVPEDEENGTLTEPSEQHSAADEDWQPKPVDEKLNWAAPEDKDWRDVTGRQMLRHDDRGRLVEPLDRPPTAKTFASQTTDHQHDNLLSFLIDDRYFKGKEPMKAKRTIKNSILHNQLQKKTKKSKALRRSKSAAEASAVVTNAMGGPVSKDGGKRLGEEKRRMEQNRILRQVTEDEFQRETERRMMLATIANPQKRLMLHRYFEEQRELAAKKIEALVLAQEHSMLTDMKLTQGPDLRGPNFEKTYEAPDYFPLQASCTGHY